MRLLKAQGMPGSRHEPCILTLGNHIGEHFDCPRVVGLKTKLMDRHAAHSWAGIVEHSLDQRPHDIDG